MSRWPKYKIVLQDYQSITEALGLLQIAVRLISLQKKAGNQA